MSVVLKPLRLFYQEFGLGSLHDAGPNAYIIVTARTCRMFAYGTNSLILALFFAELKFSDFRIGLFMSLTLLGDVFLGIWLTLIADKVGRRRVLFLGSFLMVMSGFIFAVFENFWILLLAAIVGVVSATGGDFGPFRAIEESILSELTSPTTRADVFTWYVTTSILGLSIGSEASGRIVHYLNDGEDGWALKDAYHTIFWIYTAMGLVNALLVLLLTDACELKRREGTGAYSQIATQDIIDDEYENNSDSGVDEPSRRDGTSKPPQNASKKSFLSKFTSQLSSISLSSRRVMYKLWVLLALDSVADGMVPYTLTNYYIDDKFHPAKSTLGDVTSIAYFLGSVSSVFAGPLARKIGLVSTMVFTHVPSSAAVLLFPAPSSFWMTAFLLLVRAGLNNMDQAPRSAFIAAVTKADERTAVMGITNMLRTLAAMLGPSITGVLAGNDQFWVAFVVAGSCRLLYDFGLYVMFKNTPLHEHEGGAAAVAGGQAAQRRQRDEEEELPGEEMDELPSPMRILLSREASGPDGPCPSASTTRVSNENAARSEQPTYLLPLFGRSARRRRQARRRTRAIAGEDGGGGGSGGVDGDEASRKVDIAGDGGDGGSGGVGGGGGTGSRSCALGARALRGLTGQRRRLSLKHHEG
ncbi:para-aminobenzoate synthetase [Microdochium nivale]|nr:para-aminobenzoate synthetase [Microdochium nivale]